MKDVKKQEVEYHVEQWWMGWWGGWGSSRRIQDRLNNLAAQNWRLVQARTMLRFWIFIVPRPKALLIFQRFDTD